MLLAILACLSSIGLFALECTIEPVISEPFPEDVEHDGSCIIPAKSITPASKPDSLYLFSFVNLLIIKS